jgi:hypothetical protein
MDDELERIIEDLIDLLVAEYFQYQQHRSEILWQALWLEGNYKLIETLRLAEIGDFKTVIIPDEGFSTNMCLHYLVLDWLDTHHINTLSVSSEVKELERACSWRIQV